MIHSPRMPVSATRLLTLINSMLQESGHRVLKTPMIRNDYGCYQFSEYYRIHSRSGVTTVISVSVDIEKLGRQLGVLHRFEYLAKE